MNGTAYQSFNEQISTVKGLAPLQGANNSTIGVGTYIGQSQSSGVMSLFKKKDQSKRTINKDLLFLRQLNYDGQNVVINHKDNYILEDFKEDNEDD